MSGRRRRARMSLRDGNAGPHLMPRQSGHRSPTGPPSTDRATKSPSCPTPITQLKIGQRYVGPAWQPITEAFSQLPVAIATTPEATPRGSRNSRRSGRRIPPTNRIPPRRQPRRMLLYQPHRYMPPTATPNTPNSSPSSKTTTHNLWPSKASRHPASGPTTAGNSAPSPTSESRTRCPNPTGSRPPTASDAGQYGYVAKAAYERGLPALHTSRFPGQVFSR